LRYPRQPQAGSARCATRRGVATRPDRAESVVPRVVLRRFRVEFRLDRKHALTAAIACTSRPGQRVQMYTVLCGEKVDSSHSISVVRRRQLVFRHRATCSRS
jgi:hypothetical protein